MPTTIQVVNGKQGRGNIDENAYQLLSVTQTLAIESETLSEECINERARHILEMARGHAGHDFSDGCVETTKGYKIAVVALNTRLEATKCTVHLYRPVCSGGHVLFGNKKEVQNVVSVTHDNVDIDEAGSNKLPLYIAKIRGLDVLLMVPNLDHPGLLASLDLEKKGDGTDTSYLVQVRICDGLGLGRSLPKLSIGKFKFLFPGEKLDVSMQKSRRRASKKTRDEKEEEDEPHGRYSTIAKRVCTQDTQVRDYLTKVLQEQMEFYRENTGVASELSKRADFQISMHFLQVFEGLLGLDKFNEIFVGFIKFPPSYMMEFLAHQHNIVLLTTAGTEYDMDAAEKILDSVQHMRATFTV